MEGKIIRSPLFLLAGIIVFAYGGSKFWDLCIIPHVHMNLPKVNFSIPEIGLD